MSKRETSGKANRFQDDNASMDRRANGSTSTSKRSGKKSRSTRRGNNSNYRKPSGSDGSEKQAAGYSGNHSGWYDADPKLTQDVSNVFFSYRTGDKMPVAMKMTSITGTDSHALGYDTVPFVMPGILSIGYTPVYGNLSSAQSAGNIASTAVYSFVRHANSGSRNYDHVDYMLYLMAMDSIYSAIVYCQRLIATVMTFNRWNTYTPNALLTAMGCQPTDGIAGELPEMRFRLNSMILKATTLAVPAAFPIYERHAFMNSNVYVDEPNDTAQFYLFTPRQLYQFAYDTSNAGYLKLVDFATNDAANAAALRTWRQLFDITEGLINSVYGDEDAGIMSGDTLKAYGESGLVHLATVPSDLALVPVYDHDMLEQIHNATLHGKLIKPATATADPGIYQVNPAPNVSGPYLSNSFSVTNAIAATASTSAHSVLLDLHQEPSPEAVMRATRLMNHIVFKQAGADAQVPEIDWALSELSSEIANDCAVYWFTNTGTIAGTRFDRNYWGDANSFGVTGVEAWVRITTFSLHPTLWVLPKFDGTRPAIALPLASLDRATALSFASLDRLNQAALLGLFNVPRLTLAK
nr:MAG TPA: capsid [Picobirnaviridae sp.]